MLSFSCPKCSNKLEVGIEEICLLRLYQCAHCNWVIDLEKVKNMGRTILITSGKGGVGKTFTAANLAISLSMQGKRVVVIDANLGLANQHILMNVNSPYSLYDYINGEKSLDEVKVSTSWNVDFIKGSAEIQKLSGLKQFEQKLILDKILSSEMEYDFTIIDMPDGNPREHQLLLSCSEGSHNIDLKQYNLDFGYIPGSQCD